MKKQILLFILTLAGLTVSAQNGLEGIIVETYYISDTNDTVANSTDGVLPVGSVTYRVFADMLPGYKLQAIYGTSAPLHELKFATTTTFFNNEDRGSWAPTFSKSQASGASVMLDSWISVGAACTGQYGVLKSEDNGLLNVVNSNSPIMLQNANPLAGIPLTVQDGFIIGTPSPQAITLVGISSSSDLALIDNTNDPLNGNSFISTNGSIASLAGSSGPDPLTNKVLIGQFTTKGVFTFEFNIQVGTPTGGTQQFVAANQTGNEVLLPSLTYSSASSISKVKSESFSFDLYPNPSENNVKIRINKASANKDNSLKIFDIVGNLVSERVLGKVNGNHVETIDLSNIANGQYIIQLNIDGVKSSKKIIKN
jgi:Secretion system C-terminal sorting domain